MPSAVSTRRVRVANIIDATVNGRLILQIAGVGGIAAINSDTAAQFLEYPAGSSFVPALLPLAGGGVVWTDGGEGGGTTLAILGADVNITSGGVDSLETQSGVVMAAAPPV